MAGAIPIHESPKDRALVGYDNIEMFAKLVIADAIGNVREWEKDSRNHISYLLRIHYGIEK